MVGCPWAPGRRGAARRGRRGRRRCERADECGAVRGALAACRLRAGRGGEHAAGPVERGRSQRCSPRSLASRSCANPPTPPPHPVAPWSPSLRSSPLRGAGRDGRGPGAEAALPGRGLRLEHVRAGFEMRFPRGGRPSGAALGPTSLKAHHDAARRGSGRRGAGSEAQARTLWRRMPRGAAGLGSVCLLIIAAARYDSMMDDRRGG